MSAFSPHILGAVLRAACWTSAGALDICPIIPTACSSGPPSLVRMLRPAAQLFSALGCHAVGCSPSPKTASRFTTLQTTHMVILLSHSSVQSPLAGSACVTGTAICIKLRALTACIRHTCSHQKFGAGPCVLYKELTIPSLRLQT
jgi:hypothetical protein